MGMMRGIVTGLLLMLLFAGCQTIAIDQQQVTRSTKAAPTRVTPTSSPAAPTATLLPPATAEPTATPAPTVTPTPTATAEPMLVVGDPRMAAEQGVGMNRDVVCGLVDFFDFPLEPPHARENVRGGGDFGRYRGRYDKFHAGEDWWINGRRSLGAPVYSAGNGRVTYAEPTGWGRDQGVIIVRHTFADGHELLSFYGHLDPESFKVRAGDCVHRGEMMAKIGKPKTSPHLHFEMRTHMPLETGTGYWPEDPTLVGWVPPSATIWESRLAASPGVLWTKAFAGSGIESVASMGEDLFIAQEGMELVGIELSDGGERWRAALEEDVESVLLDEKERLIYAANQFGEVSAFALPDGETSIESVELLPLWVADLDVIGIPELLPLPGGGVVISSWGEYAALSAEGELLWTTEMGARPFDWLISGERLIVSSPNDGGSLWSADAGGWYPWDASTGGRLSASGDQVWLYDGQAIYRLDPEQRSAKKLRDLSPGNLQMGDILALPEGMALIAHEDAADQRLLMVDETGHLLWERSIAGSHEGAVELFAHQGQRFLFSRRAVSSGSEVSLLAIDENGARLTYLFNGGTRDEAVDHSQVYGLGTGRILINIDGRSLTVIDTPEADFMVSSYPANSR